MIEVDDSTATTSLGWEKLGTVGKKRSAGMKFKGSAGTDMIAMLAEHGGQEKA